MVWKISHNLGKLVGFFVVLTTPLAAQTLTTRDVKTPAATLKLAPGTYTGGTLFKVRAPVQSVDIQDVTLPSALILIDTLGSGRINGGTVARVNVAKVGPRGFIRAKGSNLTFEDITASGFAVNTSADDVPCGICLIGKGAGDKGTGFVFRRVSIDGVTQTGTKYGNGDGLATEAGYSNVRYEDVRVTNNTDAGIDNKASNATCSNVYSAGNGKNLKLWYGFTCDGPVVSENPRSMHIRLSPKADGSSVFRFAQVTFRSTGKQPLIVNDSSYKATVIIDRCVIDVPAGTVKVVDPKKRLVLKLGVGC